MLNTSKTNDDNDTKVIGTKLTGMTVKERETVVAKWRTRFKTAKDFREPYQDKWLAMHHLYRAYREVVKYAYQTKLIPPIAFEIVETVKPRLASAKINVRILPRHKGDADSKSLDAWDDLISYDLDEINFGDKKIDWVNSQLIYGNGVAALTWKPNQEEDNDGDPFFEIQDLWLFYPDPEATSLQEDSKWEIVQSYKTKKELEKEEDARGENKIYQNLETLNDKIISNDPRKERYEINTKKMGLVSTASSADITARSTTEDKMTKVKKVELLQIWDHEDDMLIVIANQEELIRYEKNPYMAVNGGRIFIDLPDHPMPWEFWAIGHIEPVETTIVEIADSRNQAMDDIAFSLDPVRKVRKDANITADDIIYEPGAIWELKRADDVVTERPPEISKQWMEKDEVLRREVQTSLAISEYAMGMPKSSTEAMGKVSLLLTQTNIRFSLLLRQFEIATTQMVNNLVELNQEFLTEDKSYRLVGDDVDFKEFKKKDKEVKVDSKVVIDPLPMKSPQKKEEDALELYKIFVGEDKPDPNNEKEVKRWIIRKRAIQKMILEEFGKEEYIDLILGTEEESKKQPEPEKLEMPQGGLNVGIPPIPPQPLEMPSDGQPIGQGVSQGMPPAGLRALMAKIPLLNRL